MVFSQATSLLSYTGYVKRDDITGCMRKNESRAASSKYSLYISMSYSAKQQREITVVVVYDLVL